MSARPEDQKLTEEWEREKRATEQRSEKPTHRYFLALEGLPFTEVSKEAFVNAERAAGFVNTMGQPLEPATGGFSGHGVSGRVEYVRPEAEGSAPISPVGQPVYPPAFRELCGRDGDDIFFGYSYEEALKLYLAGVAEGVLEGRRQAAQEIADEIDALAGRSVCEWTKGEARGIALDVRGATFNG